MKNESVEHLFCKDNDEEFWWAQCSVDGCKAMACRAVNSDKCHPHTFTGLKGKIMRLKNRIIGLFGG